MHRNWLYSGQRRLLSLTGPCQHGGLDRSGGTFERPRLGFERAIILLEEGCAQFSNIHGLTHIAFPKGNLEPAFEKIRQVLERESTQSVASQSSQTPTRLLAETRSLKAMLKEIRRRWPESSVLKAPLNRFLWGAEIGQKQIDADVQEGMRFHDKLWEYAADLEKYLPNAFSLARVMQNQQERQFYDSNRVFDLLDDYADRLQDMCI